MQKSEQAAVVPASTKLDLCDKNIELFQHVAKWLRKHGKLVKPKLSSAQKEEMNVVFRLMDEDGSGAIDVEEMQNAFNLLGYRFNKHEIRELISEVAEEGKEEVNYDEFLEVMTVSLIQMTQNDRARTHQFPVSLISTAYTRKKLLEQILEGTAEGFAQVLQAGEEQQKKKEQERLAAEERAKQVEMEQALPSDAIIRVSQVSRLSLGVLRDALSPKEIQALAGMSAKLQGGTPTRVNASLSKLPSRTLRALSMHPDGSMTARLQASLLRHEERPPPPRPRLKATRSEGTLAARLHMSLPRPEPSPRSSAQTLNPEDIRSLRAWSLQHEASPKARPLKSLALSAPRPWEPEDVTVHVSASLPVLPPLVGSPKRKGLDLSQTLAASAGWGASSVNLPTLRRGAQLSDVPSSIQRGTATLHHGATPFPDAHDLAPLGSLRSAALGSGTLL